jgi:pimeloyl-ACP methyl ester carboxylesterase
MQTTARNVAVDDIQVHVEERGSGQPLLLLHGLTGSGGDFAHVFDLDALGSDYRVIAPDARGHGRSTNPGGAFTIRRCARDVVGLLDALGVEHALAVGVSLGALTLLHVATEAPARIARMILVSAAPRFSDGARASMRVQGGLAALLANAGGEDLGFTPDRLAAITADTLVVSGDRDPLHPVELAVDLYRGIAHAALYVVPGGGHSPVFLAERDAFARRALPFLRAGLGVEASVGAKG